MDEHKHSDHGSMMHEHSTHEHHNHREHSHMNHEHREQDVHDHGAHNHHDHHTHMVQDFRKRFWISLGLTLPVLALSPMIQQVTGFADVLRFSGDLFIAFLISSVIIFYGGWPFLNGMVDELKKKTPGMMR